MRVSTSSCYYSRECKSSCTDFHWLFACGEQYGATPKDNAWYDDGIKEIVLCK